MPIDYGTNDVSTSGIIQTPQLKIITDPGQGDYIDLYSPNRWLLGMDETFFSDSNATYDKWASVEPGDASIQLTLKAGVVFGQTIKDEDLSGKTVTVDQGSPPVYRNDGDGLGAATHVDFINSLFTAFGLKSTMKTHPTKCKINFCKLDKFLFVIEETGDAGDTALDFPKNYVLSSVEPWGLRDWIAQSLYYWQNEGNGYLWDNTP